jgi:hypothetical protein
LPELGGEIHPDSGTFDASKREGKEMAKAFQVSKFTDGIEERNKWRGQSLGREFDLAGAELAGAELNEANLH